MAALWTSIWEHVSPHRWKYRQRTRQPDAILWHATRGGQWYNGKTEYSAAINWFKSPNNRISYPGGDYAGISHYLIGPGVICEVVAPDNYIPAWSSYPSDEHAISVEIAQSNKGQEIEKETIEACKEFTLWAEQRWNIPHVFTGQIVDDRNWKGHSGHALTIQGKMSGKSDPDQVFWDAFLVWLAGEQDMDEQTVRRIVQEELKKLSLESGFGTDNLSLALSTIWNRIKKAGVGAKEIADAFDPFRMP